MGDAYAMAVAASYARAVNIDSRYDETAISCDSAAALSGAVAALGFCRSSQPAESPRPRLHRLGFFCTPDMGALLWVHDARNGRFQFSGCCHMP